VPHHKKVGEGRENVFLLNIWDEGMIQKIVKTDITRNSYFYTDK